MKYNGSMSENQENQGTLHSYEIAGAEGYLASHPHLANPEVMEPVKGWLNRVLALVPPNGRVLELGSALGRDADYIESHGYSVERTDAAQTFVDYMQKQGHSARLLDLVHDELGGPYDMVFANAVLLHLTGEETEVALHKVRNSLSKGGVLAFSVKPGDGEEWTEAKMGEARYYNYWTAEGLSAQLTKANYQVLELFEGRSQPDNTQRLFVMATPCVPSRR